MTITDRIYATAFPRFRLKRLKRFISECGVKPYDAILDVGGTEFFWTLALESGIPLHNITILNKYPAHGRLPSQMRWIVADGRHMPFPDRTFDFVFCNSVIEHLETMEAMHDLADEIRRVATSYFVQTPDPSFFVEPHTLTPFVHWLPRDLYQRTLAWTSARHILFGEKSETVDQFQKIRLITPAELSNLFPDATIAFERWCGLRKSIIAFRQRANHA